MLLARGVSHQSALAKSRHCLFGSPREDVWKSDVRRVQLQARGGDLHGFPVQARRPRPFSEVPTNGSNGWINLVRFWMEKEMHNIHFRNVRNFQQLGPIYREKLGNLESVFIINPEDAARLFKAEGSYPERYNIPPWTAYHLYMKKPLGILLKSSESWKKDRSFLNHLMLTADSVNNFEPLISPVTQDFVKIIYKGIERSGEGKFTVNLNQDLFGFAFETEDYVQSFYHEQKKRKELENYPGLLPCLLRKNTMDFESIKGNITELMAGGVDTTSMTIQWCMYEMARNIKVQDMLRAEVQTARRDTQGDIKKMYKAVPLLRAAIKETLRLHPIAVTIQRYLPSDLVLQDYTIPAKTLVQVGLFAMGRDPNFFPNPEKFDPRRWLHEDTYFRALSFGFGPRQCIGRRIAELEMTIFLIHILENFKIEIHKFTDVGTTFNLILMPDKPIIFTFRPLKPQV
ncbi:cholesterol side-chain cleavage enzyme, mitochondrial isoform X2 [Monodelphis domestica]|uniref:cholesterol side-chain cleavage enzyme, mitochondrial isoform X2 n=1 Tax=Monodelphis domestica TaxID=13616 RepID=UPI0007B3FC7C|nr:cholesterol side-chain cleavage enzyme, mitochondrial isoform X2 [Monodelphis domestica]